MKNVALGSNSLTTYGADFEGAGFGLVQRAAVAAPAPGASQMWCEGLGSSTWPAGV